MIRAASYGWLMFLIGAGCRATSHESTLRPVPSPAPLAVHKQADSPIVQASFQAQEESQPPRRDPPAQDQPETLPPPAQPVAPLPPQIRRGEMPVTLDEVTLSVIDAFPGLDAAMRELEIAEGKELSGWGSST